MKQNFKAVIISVVLTAILTATLSMVVVFPMLEEEKETVAPVADQTPEPKENKDALVKNEDEADENNMIKIDQEDYDYLIALYDKYEELEVLQQYIDEYYYKDVSEIDFMSEMAKGMFEALDDPYSQYFTPEEYKRMLEDTNGTYEGIGVVVAPGEDGFITVVSPISTSPGFEAGLKTNDKIIMVNGEEFFADTLSDAVKNIRGPKGTEVILTIRRLEEVLEIPVTRREIEMDAVASEVLDDNIGYIKIATFDDNVAAEFKSHYDALDAEGIEGLIIDLRFNGGGYLNQCIALTDMLMGEGIIVKTKDRAGKEEVSYSGEKYIDEFLVILTNEGSASASEILTGAVKDNEEGIIVGQTTFGKGLVQTMRPLLQFDQAGFKLTIQQYFTPKDHYIHGTGIEPNIILENDPDTDLDEQLEKAIEVMLENIK